MKDKITKRDIGLIVMGAVLLHWGLNYLDRVFHMIAILAGFLFPFLLGGGLAFLLNLPMRFFERWILRGMNRWHSASARLQRMARPVSILLTLTIIAGIIAGLVSVIVPQMSETISAIRSELPTFLAALQTAEAHTGQMAPIMNFLEQLGLDLAKFSATLSQVLESVGAFLRDRTLDIVTAVFDKAVSFGIAFAFAIYLLSGKERIMRHVKRFLKAYCSDQAVERVRSGFHLADDTFSSFFTGQCLEACILGGMFFVGMNILRFPHAALISVLVSVTALIPIFGAFIACVIGAFLMLVESPMMAVWFVVFFLVMQQIEGNFIYPHVMGSRVGLPSICVLVAVTLGGAMFGIIGMLLFIPIFSILYTLYQKNIEKRILAKSDSTI